METMAPSNSLCFHRSPRALAVEFLQVVLPLSLFYLWLLRLHAAGRLAWLASPEQLTVAYRVVCLLWFTELVRRYFNDLFVFGRTRLLHFSGRVSFRLQQIAICYDDIREIQVEQPLVGRLLDYGTLQFSTASRGCGKEIWFRDITGPQDLSRLVQQILVTRTAGVPDASAPDRALELPAPPP